MVFDAGRADVSPKAHDGPLAGPLKDSAGRQHTKVWPTRTAARLWADDGQAQVRSGTHRNPRAGRVLLGEWHGRWLTARVVEDATRRADAGYGRDVLAEWSGVIFSRNAARRPEQRPLRQLPIPRTQTTRLQPASRSHRCRHGAQPTRPRGPTPKPARKMTPDPETPDVTHWRAAEVSTVVDVANEAQARELAGLPVETQGEVFAAAHEATLDRLVVA